MGLAGRKTKQRIGADPRNLTWSDDSSKFGAKYLESLGWTSGTGLGVSGDGRTTNLKIHQKLDLMGIGANRRGPDGDDAGWRGGREFEGLLARLNQAQNADTQDVPVDEHNVGQNDNSGIDHSMTGIESMARKTSLQVIDHPPETNIDESDGKTRRKGDEHRKKRKRCITEDGDVDAKEAKRRRKEEKRERKEQRRAKKAAKKLTASQNSQNGLGDQAQVASANDVRPPTQHADAVTIAPRYRAHRARNIASKRLAAVSAKGMNEILGISSSSGSNTEVSSFPTLTPTMGPTGAPGLDLSYVNDRLEPATGPDDRESISTMGLGSRSSFRMGLGSCSARETTNVTPESAGNDQLRKSGKTVAEYFAERLRMKSTSKFEISTVSGAENPKDRKENTT